MSTFAEVFPPGEFLREELEARNWSQTELAEIIGRPVRLINEIIAGKKAITPETAIQLGESLGTGPEVWMNLESQYQLSKVRMADNLIKRRADLYNRFPVREMIKRGWVSASTSIDVLEQQFCQFFGIPTSAPSPLSRTPPARPMQRRGRPCSSWRGSTGPGMWRVNSSPARTTNQRCAMPCSDFRRCAPRRKKPATSLESSKNAVSAG